jgi:hypothetical protein
MLRLSPPQRRPKTSKYFGIPSAFGPLCNTDLTTISPPILRIYSCVVPKAD